jgi:uncharacterized protein (TIGR02300 family)
LAGRARVLAPSKKTWSELNMVKPEWGAKRTCPKCSTRFYDLGNDNPVTCIECGNAWMPEPVLKSKQPLPFESPAAAAGVAVDDAPADSDLGAEDLAIPDEDEEPSADDEVDLGTGDDDLGVEASGDEDEH